MPTIEEEAYLSWLSSDGFWQHTTALPEPLTRGVALMAEPDGLYVVDADGVVAKPHHLGGGYHTLNATLIAGPTLQVGYGSVGVVADSLGGVLEQVSCR